MYFQRKCRFCGKVFETKRYPNQFCSQSCYFKSKRAQRNAAKVNAIKQANPELQPVIQDGLRLSREGLLLLVSLVFVLNLAR